VRANGGARDDYAPVDTLAGAPVNGDAVALADAYVRRLALADVYVADLDAIGGGAVQQAVISRIGSIAGTAWVDAGVSSVDQARDLTGLGVARVIVGLETLTSWEALAAICDAIGGERVVFSLDLRDGRLLGRPGLHTARQEPVQRAAARAAAAGVESVLVLDLARVGRANGPDLDLIRPVRLALPNTKLLAGGGVRDAADLERLDQAGCDGVLVATALLDGRIGAAEIARWRARIVSARRRPRAARDRR
jgi:phosphoribosylformimino-5-aminoimidazole carboxamide ribotide isomerase